jgi:maleylpyruvate isomerase
MILYDYFRSSAAYRVRIALNLKGLNAEHRFVHLRKGQARAPEYLAINPQALVPSLALDQAVLRQSLSIIEYLDEMFPEVPLLPSDALGRARVRSLALAIACDIHPLNNLRVLNYLRDTLSLDEAAINAWCKRWIEDGLSALEALLTSESPDGDFCHGESPTLADVCLMPQVFSAERFGCDLGTWPRIQSIAERCRTLDAFILASPERQPDAE